MQAHPHQQVVLDRGPDPRRIFCSRCEHSEFVHGDREPRRCLYTECGCSGFPVGALQVDQGPANRAKQIR